MSNKKITCCESTNDDTLQRIDFSRQFMTSFQQIMTSVQVVGFPIERLKYSCGLLTVGSRCYPRYTLAHGLGVKLWTIWGGDTLGLLP